MGDQTVWVAVHMQVDRCVTQLAELGLAGPDYQIGALGWAKEVDFQVPSQCHRRYPIAGEHQKPRHDIYCGHHDRSRYVPARAKMEPVDFHAGDDPVLGNLFDHRHRVNEVQFAEVAIAFINGHSRWRSRRRHPVDATAQRLPVGNCCHNPYVRNPLVVVLGVGQDRPMTLHDLDDDQRYRALKSRDVRFDGVFIVGVRTTGVYCRPSCPTPVHPLRKNVDFFLTTAGAQRAGLRACKRCRPDATPGSPEWNVREDLVGRSMRLINQGYLDTHSVNELAGALAVTERHLRRIMIDAVGAPPLAIARAQRAQTARTLIETTSMRFVDVAFASGFSSLRQFNDTIREVFDATPTVLRAKRNLPSVESGSLSIRLPFRAPFASDYFLGWADRRTVAGVASVADGKLSTALRLEHGNGIAVLDIADEWVQCELELDDVADLAAAVAQCRRMLDLDADPTHIDAALKVIEPIAGYVHDLPGLRSPGSSDGFATLVFAILGQQRSVSAARTLASRIAARASGVNERLQPFPTPAEIAETDLSDIGLTRRTAETIYAVAALFDDRTNELTPGADRDEIRKELVAVKGIGPWTANYIAMRALGHPDIFLAGDLVADRSADSLGLTSELMATASPWRSYLTHHLWAASASLKAAS